jgi:hypothetical protein
VLCRYNAVFTRPASDWGLSRKIEILSCPTFPVLSRDDKTDGFTGGQIGHLMDFLRIIGFLLKIFFCSNRKRSVTAAPRRCSLVRPATSGGPLWKSSELSWYGSYSGQQQRPEKGTCGRIVFKRVNSSTLSCCAEVRGDCVEHPCDRWGSRAHDTWW